MMRTLPAISFLAAALLMAPMVLAAPVSDTSAYTLANCPVSGAELGSMGDPVVNAYDGREVRFCCDGCVPKYEEDQAKYDEKIDKQIVAQQKERYPLDTCVVSGEKLGSMGDPVEYVHENRLVRLCCAGCTGKFEKDPEAHIAKIDAAVVEQQGEDYAAETCVVMTENELGGTPTDFVVANRLVRLCCNGCVDDVKAEPVKYLDAVEKAE
ncbi:MAG: hypothetical protein ACLFTT_09220 [Candidatus Hydrogenedentota bacterium]